MYTGLHTKHHKCTQVFTQSTPYSRQILIKLKSREGFEKCISDFTEVRPVVAEFFLANGQMDRRTDGRTERQPRQTNNRF